MCVCVCVCCVTYCEKEDVIEYFNINAEAGKPTKAKLTDAFKIRKKLEDSHSALN